MYMNLRALKFLFQKPILLHYLLNRVQLYHFLDSLSSKAQIQGAAAAQSDTDGRANRVDRTKGQDELQNDYIESDNDLLLFNCI